MWVWIEALLFLRALKGRRGWYARVIQGGTVNANLPVQVVEPTSV